MKNLLFSPGTEEKASSLAMLLLRLAGGGMMLTHGTPKLLSYSENAADFPDPFGFMGPALALILTIFAEFFCAIFIIAGFASRISAFFLMFTMLTAAFVIHWDDPFGRKEFALLYFVIFLAIFIAGPGSFSLDRLIAGKK